MYTQFFSLKQIPFSIAPDPRYLFMTEGHREALAHLMFGIGSGGGVVLLTGEIGAGKTTVCRCFLEQVPANCNVAYIFNPKLTVDELLHAVCDEFRIPIKAEAGGAATIKDYVDALTRHLLASHAEGRNNVLIIDEAQNLSADVLEQLRLLTNLETNERKLLQIILIGQPELRDMLDRPELKQLAQRVIARYHLTALSEHETASYIQHRLTVAGLITAPPFQRKLAKRIHRLTQGVPRRINLLCDRALLGAYSEGKREVDNEIIDKAAREVFGPETVGRAVPRRRLALGGLLAGVVAIGAISWTMRNGGLPLQDDAAITSGKRMAAGAVTPAASSNTASSPDSTLPATSAAALSASSAAGSAPAAAAQAAAVADAQAPAPGVATPSVATPGTATPDTDRIAIAGLKTEADALRQLARESWGQILPDGEPCTLAQSKDLRCFWSTSGIAELRQLDRPAVIVLHDSDGRTHHMLLTGLADSSATIRAGDASQTLSLVVLMRYFRGQFATLWRTPPKYEGGIKLGSRGPDVDWIAAQLARIDGVKPAGGPQVFDEKMVKRVRDFQNAQGLRVDGLVGPVTFMHLNRVAGIEEPRLRALPAGTPPNPAKDVKSGTQNTDGTASVAGATVRTGAARATSRE